MTNPALIAPTFGDADYFDSLLNLEREAGEQIDLPSPLQELIELILAEFEKEGTPIEVQRPSLIQKSFIAAAASSPASLVFERRLADLHQIVLLEQSAVIFLAGSLLGQQNSARLSAASSTELQIVESMFSHGLLTFSKVTGAQKPADWSVFMAASLLLGKAKHGPAIIVMANRRDGSSKAQAAVLPDVVQQMQLRQAISKGMCQVEYILDAGQVSLATLKSLRPGSILPLKQPERGNVRAKANGAVVLNGTWQFATDQMRVSITDVLAKEVIGK